MTWVCCLHNLVIQSFAYGIWKAISISRIDLLLRNLPLMRRTLFCWRSSELKLIYDRQSVGQSVLVSGSHLQTTTRFSFPVLQLRVSWCGALSLTRGWVCNIHIQFTDILMSKSCRIHDHALLSHLRLLGSTETSVQFTAGHRPVDQYVLVPDPLLGPMTRFFFLFSWSENFLILKWGALSDERTGL
jgi:hypothetical protein